jgi:hypothetical protein
VYVNSTQVYVNSTQVNVNSTQVNVNPTQVYVNSTQVYVNSTQVREREPRAAGGAAHRAALPHAARRRQQAHVHAAGELAG